MNLNLVLAFVSAGLSVILAIGAAIRARSLIGRWAFVAGMLVLAAERVCGGLLVRTPLPDAMYNWQLVRLTAMAFFPGCWLLFSLTYARGNAKEFVRKWREVLVLAFLIPIGVALIFRSQLIGATEAISSEPYLLFRLGMAGTVLYLAQLVSIVLILVNLERTFRASVGTVRWRIKYVLIGVGVVFGARLYTSSQALLFRGIDPSLETLNSGALLVGCLLILRSLFRIGHFDVDVYPSHSVLQGSVTILLAGIYLLIVGVFAKIVAYFGGNSAFAIETLVVLLLLVVLAVLLQSDRARLFVRRFVSRNFRRPMYDYRTVWRQFTEGTASQVEQTAYCRAVVRLLTDIFQTLSVTLWIIDDQREELTLAASSSVSPVQAREHGPNAVGAAAVINYIRTHRDPVDFENVKDEWAEVLRHCHPLEFRKGGTRVCVPVTSGGEPLALVILGDRVSGVEFTVQDLDLLKSIGEHVASGLVNARLSQRLLQAREHEAFQTMAAFFVHDLKNAASTLNLMLQNLPTHFDDPEFREDALRGVGKSVAHINHLISRLTQLRSELRIQPTDSDLNSMVTDALSDFRPDGAFKVEQNLTQLPPIALDRDQFRKVLTNLILNAREATSSQGVLRLSTTRAGAWAVLEATDNGCGMNADFLANSLFRPFQTTKKNGLGIGMFQSKMIIEAHGGRIAVESAQGHGTTFRVFLPLSNSVP